MYGLTEREREVLRCLLNGWSNAKIAQQLFLAEAIVRKYLTSIYAKPGVLSRSEAINRGYELE